MKALHHSPYGDLLGAQGLGVMAPSSDRGKGSDLQVLSESLGGEPGFVVAYQSHDLRLLSLIAVVRGKDSRGTLKSLSRTPSS